MKGGLLYDEEKDVNPMTHRYKTSGVCAREILIDVEDGVVKDVRYVGGCNGNTQGIGKLVVGMKAEDVIDRLSGISCNGRPTSCPDQLARALREILRA